MLSKKEKALMKVVYKTATEKNGVCLISPLKMLTEIPYKIEFCKEDVEPTLRALALEDYFDVVDTNKSGETLYCITLHQKGKAFIREIQGEKRAIYFKIVLTLAGAVGAFIIGKLLQLLF